MNTELFIALCSKIGVQYPVLTTDTDDDTCGLFDEPSNPIVNEAETQRLRVFLETLLEDMRVNRLDWTRTFNALTVYLEDGIEMEEFGLLDPAWRSRWLTMQPNGEMMRKINPRIIPRNQIVQRLVDKYSRIVAQNMDTRTSEVGDEFINDQFAELDEFMTAIRSPYNITTTTDKFDVVDSDSFDAKFKTHCGT
eukprot:GHVH01014488.1.p2 GENE.GHVH01014488.1~~GHVH01014488.1.p2  ORF type:complete len:194 (+),score=33.45 GHVH01014488.1:1202-1783(+)